MTYRHALSLAGALAAVVACAPGERDAADTVPDTTAPAVTEHGITLREWAVELAQDTVPAGSAVFVARNAGQFEHAFAIEIEGTQLETLPIPPGAEARLAVDLTPGTYTIYCPINDGGHREQGMEATLVVR